MSNPALILGQISGFSNEPNRVAFDLILQAESGIMSMNGQEDGPPTKMPIALIDVLAGHQLKEGILCALLEKGKTGKGKLVSVSLYDTAIASLVNQASNWLMAGHLPSRIGSMHPNIAPYGELFTTKDGDTITFAIGSDKQFENLCGLVLAEWNLDNSFNSNTNRVIHRKELFKVMSSTIASFDFDFLNEGCKALQIPMAKIKTLEEVFEDPYTQSLILEEDIDGVPTKRVRTIAFK
jgi:crotonobetainyl-CoA:carnitine CoA-transferase CaiB-like acyl-CoA transferase